MIIEIDRKILRNECNGSIKKAIAGKWYMVWDNNRIKRAFYGHGTIKDFERYKQDNKIYSIWIEI